MVTAGMEDAAFLEDSPGPAFWSKPFAAANLLGLNRTFN
jgi:hypothetical protein